jgi:biotin carboxylase
MWRLWRGRSGWRRRRLRLTETHSVAVSRAARGSSPRVLLVALHNSYRIAAYQAAAASLGVRLVIASEGRHSIVPEIADGLHIDLARPSDAVNRIVGESRQRPFDAVIACDDITIEIASRAAAELHLGHNPVDAVRTARRKDLARERLRVAGLPVPRFTCVDLLNELAPQIRHVDYPCVVKPLAMAASRGVVRADTPRELESACRRVADIVAEAADPEERHRLLVESFIPGAEIAVEGLLANGRLETLAVFDKPDPLDGPYFEETYYITPSRLPAAVLDKACERLTEACKAYGLREGAVHGELRIHDDEAWVIEIAARTIGGDCARLLDFGAGRSLEELILRQALGWSLPLEAQPRAAGVLMIPTPGAGTLRRVEGVLAARQIEGIEEIVIAVREGYELVPLPEGGSYLGFMFARGDTPGQVEQSLRRAHACLNIVIAPAWRVVAVAQGGAAS